MREREALKTLPAQLLTQVNFLLEDNFGREIFRLTGLDTLRLLTLKAWQIKYKVSLEYILQTIVPFYLATIAKKFSTNPNSLGFKVSTLCGKKAEKLLQDAIAKDFGDGDNLSLWQWERKQEIFHSRTTDEEFGEAKIKTIIDYPKVSRYVKAYRRRVSGKQKDFEKELLNPANTKRQYRDNPWV